MRIIWGNIEADCDPFRLETFLEPFDKEFICAYDWVFSDVDSYIFQINDQEGCTSMFDREQFWLTGEALLRHLEHVSTLVIFRGKGNN